MADNTFLGLQPYTEDDAYRFKGRTEESQELFRLIVRNDFTVCYAESGEGKTSLLNAGVFPLLRENMYFPIAITFTSDDYKVTPDSFDAIIDRCIKDSITEYNEKNKGVIVEYLLNSTDFQGLDDKDILQQELSKYSWWKLRNYKPQAMGLTFTPVFVFDQFEEVFNLPGSIVWTKKFFDWLEDVSSDSCPEVIVKKIRTIIGDKAAFPAIKEGKDFKAVFSLRKEFIGELDYWGMQTHFIPALKDNRYCLKTLTYEGAKKVMTQQERFDEDKVELVLTHFVGQYSREPERTIAENLPAIPALLLSVFCDSWEKDIAAFAKLNTDEIGQSLNKILEKFYDETVEAVIKDLTNQNKETDTPEYIRKDIDTAMFDLVDVNGKRVRVKAVTKIIKFMDSEKPVSDTLPIVKYKEILNNHRLIKISKIDGEDYVEIVHDCLCPIIAKRKEIRLAAEAKEREEQILHQRIKKRNKKLISVSVVLVLLLSIGVTSYLLLKNREIKDLNSDMLEFQSRTIAKESIELFEAGDTCTASLLALYACPENQGSPNRPYTAEAELALRTITQEKEKVLLGHNGGVNYVSFSTDDNYIVSSSDDATIVVWNLSTGEGIHKFTGHTKRVNSAHFSNTGKHVVSSSDDGTIIVWYVASGNKQQIISGSGSPVIDAIYSADDKYIMYYTDQNSNIHIWSVENELEERELVGKGERASFMRTLDDTHLLVAYSDCLCLWNILTGELEGEVDNGFGTITSALVADNGVAMSLSVSDKSIMFSYGFMGMEENSGHTGHINSATFFGASDGLLCVSVSDDYSVRVCKITDDISNSFQNELVAVFNGHSQGVKFATFNHKGDMIASASEDGTIRLWSYEPFQKIIDNTKKKYEGKALTTDDERKYIMNRRQR